MKKGSLAAWGASFLGFAGGALGTTGISSIGRRTTATSGLATSGGESAEILAQGPGVLEPLLGGTKGMIGSLIPGRPGEV